MCVCVCMCVCISVCDRESDKERERERALAHRDKEIDDGINYQEPDFRLATSCYASNQPSAISDLFHDLYSLMFKLLIATFKLVAYH